MTYVMEGALVLYALNILYHFILGLRELWCNQHYTDTQKTQEALSMDRELEPPIEEMTHATEAYRGEPVDIEMFNQMFGGLPLVWKELSLMAATLPVQKERYAVPITACEYTPLKHYVRRSWKYANH